MFPKVPTWALLAAAAFFGMGVIPIAAFGPWRQMVLYDSPFAVRISIVGFMVGFLISSVWHLFKYQSMRRENQELKTKIAKPETVDEDKLPDSVGYVDACEIVDAYIHPATHDMRPGVRLSVRRGIIERFGQITGAMLGEGQYNRKLLHQWMQSNAARFLVDHRGKML